MTQNRPVVFDIDFTDYEKTESKVARVPEGDYLARLVEVEMTTVKNESSDNFGKPGYVVTLEIVGGEFNGTKIVDRLWVIQKAKFRLDQFLSAFGIKVEPKKIQVPVQQLMNRTVTITLKDGKPFGDDNIVKSEVRRYAPASLAPKAAEAPVVEEPSLNGDSLPEATRTVEGRVGELDAAGIQL